MCFELQTFCWRKTLVLWGDSEIGFQTGTLVLNVKREQFQHGRAWLLQGQQNGDEMSFQSVINNERKSQLCFKVLVLIGG